MYPTLNRRPNLAAMRRLTAANDPRLTRITTETNNAKAALDVQDAEENLQERNAFTMAQNAALLNRGPREVGGGTYAELRRRRLGPQGMTLSGLGAANRQNVSAARRKAIDTQADGARTEIYNEYGLNSTGTGLSPAVQSLLQASRRNATRRGATVGPVSGVNYPTLRR